MERRNFCLFPFESGAETPTATKRSISGSPDAMKNNTHSVVCFQNGLSIPCDKLLSRLLRARDAVIEIYSRCETARRKVVRASGFIKASANTLAHATFLTSHMKLSWGLVHIIKFFVSISSTPPTGRKI
jgi:hypothetical protein